MYNVASFTLIPLYNVSLDIPLIGGLLLTFANVAIWLYTRKKKQAIASTFIGYALFSVFYVICCLSIADEAVKHGCDNVFAYTIQSLTQHINASPREDTVPDDLTGSVILYYRFGCTDCESIYDELQSRTSNWDNTYWVATRSAQGISIREKYPVANVPSGVYVTSSGKSVVKPLVKQSGILDTKALQELAALLSYDNT